MDVQLSTHPWGKQITVSTHWSLHTHTHTHIHTNTPCPGLAEKRPTGAGLIQSCSLLLVPNLAEVTAAVAAGAVRCYQTCSADLLLRCCLCGCLCPPPCWIWDHLVPCQVCWSGVPARLSKGLIRKLGKRRRTGSLRGKQQLRSL